MIASIILLLHLLEFLSTSDAIILLIVTGFILIIADFALGLFFMVAVNGVLALVVAGGLFGAGSTLFGVPIDWGFFFGIAIFEVMLLIPFLYMVKRFHTAQPTTGLESFIGEEAKILVWDGLQGKVIIQGETWQAQSKQTLDVDRDDLVLIEEIQKNNRLVIKAK